MGLLKLVIKTNETDASIGEKINAVNGDNQSIPRICNWLRGHAGGAQSGVNVQVERGGVQSFSTLTLSSAVATNTAVINGVTLTADTEFAVGNSDEQTAINLAAAINALATVNIVAVASVSGAVVTVKALNQGTLGDAITLTATGGITAGAATLGSGAAGTTNQIELGKTA